MNPRGGEGIESSVYGNTEYGKPSIQLVSVPGCPTTVVGKKRGDLHTELSHNTVYIHTYNPICMETLPGGSSRRIPSQKVETALVALAVHLPPLLSFFLLLVPFSVGRSRFFFPVGLPADNGCLRFVLRGNDHVPGVNQSGSEPALGLPGTIQAHQSPLGASPEMPCVSMGTVSSALPVLPFLL